MSRLLALPEDVQTLIWRHVYNIALSELFEHEYFRPLSIAHREMRQFHLEFPGNRQLSLQQKIRLRSESTPNVPFPNGGVRFSMEALEALKELADEYFSQYYYHWADSNRLSNT